MASEIHVGDIGTTFVVTIKEGTSAVDISSATTMQMVFEKPSQESVTEDALFYTDGTDGKIKYETASGDLDEPGIWHLQVYLVLDTGSWRSNTVSFRVYDNL